MTLSRVVSACDILGCFGRPDPQGFPEVPAMDTAAKQTVLRSFPYGLYALTVAHDGEEHGMTANWITQVSFEPPMVAVAVENASRTIELLRDAHHFAISVFAAGQRELAGRLGRSSDHAPDKLKGIKTKPAPSTKTPVLTEGLGWIECRVVSALPSGDHTIFLGEVLGAGVEREGVKALTLEEAGFKYSG
jgi:flavin reductase (DIM6/NTAB) family NADH-FMN oxidoreductase RutF